MSERESESERDDEPEYSECAQKGVRGGSHASDPIGARVHVAAVHTPFFFKKLLKKILK